MLFHVTANADWSNLPLSGLFVDMLRRLVPCRPAWRRHRATRSWRRPRRWTAMGCWRAAAGRDGPAADEFATTPVSPRHPPGLYGPENGRRALNLGGNLPAPEAAPAVAGARMEDSAAAAPERALGPPLLARRIVLLRVDLLIALACAGLLRPSRVARPALPLLLLAGAGRARAGEQSQPGARDAARLYRHRRRAVGRRSRPGLEGCRNTSTVARQRRWWNLTRSSRAGPTSASIRCSTGRSAPTRSRSHRTQAAALNDYMSRGGIILIDTRDSGSGAGFAPGTESALQRVGAGLVMPPLAPLTTEHVLARAFYLLQDFPGATPATPSGCSATRTAQMTASAR